MSSNSISPALRQQIAERDRHRCSYCHTLEAVTGSAFTVDHIVPEILGGQTTLENLCLACWPCNLRKGQRLVAADPETGDLVRLYHPNQQRWIDHFAWSEDGLLIVGRTPSGRATVSAFRMNDPERVSGRWIWMKAGYHPPPD